MRYAKQIMSVALSALLMMSLSPVSALAADSPTVTTGDPSITINDDSGNTYVAYQIFSGTVSDTAGQLQGIAWNTTNVDVNSLMRALANATWSTEGVAFTTDMNANQVANLMAKMADNATDVDQLAYLLGCNLSTSAQAISLTNNTATSVTNAGYYLVRSKKVATGTVGTDFILAVAGAVTATPKTPGIPTIDLQIQENSTSEWGETADNSIGEAVNFKVIVTLPTGYSMYRHYYLNIEDVMSPFDYVADSMSIQTVHIVSGGESVTTDITSLCNTKSAPTLGIPDLKSTAPNLTDGDTVVLTYTATLGEGATVGGNGNLSKATLAYSNDPTWDGYGGVSNTSKTSSDYVYDFCYELDYAKQDAFTGKALTGALFKLANKDKTKYATLSNGKVTGWVTDIESADTILTSNTMDALAGKASVIGLGSGTYTLIEVSSPAGYESMVGKEFTVAISGKTQEVASTDAAYNTATGASITSLGVTIKEADSTAEAVAGTGDTSTGKVSVIVKNTNTAMLPSTGGAGTTAFYLVGTLVVVGASGLLIRKRRAARGRGSSAEH